MVNGLVHALLCEALECVDLAQDYFEAVVNLPDYATPQARQLINAQP